MPTIEEVLKRGPQPRALGICWFRKEDYPALKRMFTDSDKMHDTWEEWLEQAERMERSAKTQVDIVERVYIDPATFPDWCASHGTTIDRQGRNAFVAFTTAEKYGGTH